MKCILLSVFVGLFANFNNMHGAGYVKYVLKYNQQDTTLFNVLYCCQCSTCYQSSDSPTLAVAANKFDKYPMLHVQFLSS